MRAKTLTKAQATKLDKLHAAENAARNAVYAFGPNNQTRFSDCYFAASDAAKQAYDSARRARSDFQYELVQAGRGYLQNGVFHAHN